MLGFLTRERSPESGQSSLAHIVAFEPERHELKAMQQNETRVSEFRLVNRGEETLKLVSVRTTCSCSVPPEGLQGKVLKPGDFLGVPIRFESGDRSGRVESSSDFRLESLTHPGQYYVVQATIIANIIEEFSYEPSSVEFGVLRPGEAREQSILVKAENGSEFELLNCESNLKSLQVSIVKSGIGKWMVNFKLQGRNTTGVVSISGLVKLKTNSERHPSIVIPVRGTVVPEIEVTPQALVLVGNAVASREHGLRVRTSNASSVGRVVANEPTGERNIDFSTRDAGASSHWASDHRIRVAEDTLTEAESLSILLSIQNSNGSNEAASVVVKIQRL